MSRPLVIGVGNPLRGDDGAGPRAAELLADQVPEADTLIVQQLTPELAEPIGRASALVLLDARAGGAPGQVATRRIDATPHSDAPPFSHQTDPALLLEMCRTLYGRCPPAVAVTIAARDFDLRESLSPPVAAALLVAVAAAREALRELTANT